MIKLRLEMEKILDYLGGPDVITRVLIKEREGKRTRSGKGDEREDQK